mgnify:CR=1 FL=1
MVDDTGQKLVPAVQNAMIIMRLLAASGRPMGATQIAREAGLNVSSAFNILRTLSHEGLLSFDPEAKTYVIGMGLMEFAAPLLGANPADLIRPTLTAIAQEHQVAIALWQITANERIELRCGKSSIVMEKDGHITIRGTYLVSHASASNRIRGGSVNLN